MGLFSKKDNQKKSKKSKKKGFKITRPGDLPKDAPMFQYQVEVPQKVAAAIMTIDSDLADLQKKFTEIQLQAKQLAFSKKQLQKGVILADNSLPDEEKITYAMNSTGEYLYVWEKDKLPKPTPADAPAKTAEEDAEKK